MTRRAERRRQERAQRERGKAGNKSRALTLITSGVILVVVAIALIFGRSPVASPQPTDAELPTPLSLGAADAPVTIMEFGDYKCPYCKMFDESVFPLVYEEFIATGQARFIYVNFPFIGPDSTTAAVAGRAVYRQDPDAFWHFHHGLFAAQGDERRQWATPQFLVDLARRVAPTIDHDRLAKDLDDAGLVAEVRQEREYARSLGVNSTPTVFVNGRPTETPSFEHIREAVEQALAEAGAEGGSSD